MPWRGTVIRDPSLLDIKKPLSTRHKSGEHTQCLVPLLWELLVLLLSLLLIFFTERQEKNPFSSRSRTSKFEVNTGIFQKTVHLGNLGNCVVKVLEASPLTPVQHLLFQVHFTTGWSHTAKWWDLPFSSTKREDVDAALPRAAWKPEETPLVDGWWQQLFLKPAELYVSLHHCRKLIWRGETGDQGKDCS